MALFQIYKGLESELNNVTMHEGYAYFCTDSGKFYIDVSNNNESIDSDGWYNDRLPVKNQEVIDITLEGGAANWIAGTGADAGFYIQTVSISDLKVGSRMTIDPYIKPVSNLGEYQFIVKAVIDTAVATRGIKFYSIKQLTNDVAIQIVAY